MKTAQSARQIDIDPLRSNLAYKFRQGNKRRCGIISNTEACSHFKITTNMFPQTLMKQ